MNPRYLQESLGYKIGSLMNKISRGGELKVLYDLVKWKNLVFEYFTKRPNCERRLEVTL